MDQTNQLSTPLRGTLVRFRIAHVLVPPAEELMRELFGNDLLQGSVVAEISADGHQFTHVAVTVDGLCDPVIVSRSQLLAPAGAAC